MKSTSQTAPFRISPSAIGRYFFHDCERFLRFSAASAELRAEENIPKREFDSSPLVRAILDSGYAWEEQVLKNHLADRVSIAQGPGKLHERRFNPNENDRAIAIFQHFIDSLTILRIRISTWQTTI